MNLVRGAAGAAFSTGPGYEPQPPGTQVSYEAVRGYYLDLRPKAQATLRPRVSGHGHVTQPGPTARAQLALGLHERWLAGDGEALAPFLNAVHALRAAAVVSGDMLLWEYMVDVPKFDCRAPWHSCMAQGQAASAFVRAYAAFGDETWAEAARSAVLPLTEGGEATGLVASTEHGPALQEARSQPPSHILNGWIFGLWGLWDVALALGDAPAGSLFRESASALSRMVEAYDAGWWTRYSLYAPAAPDLAKPFYHRIHVAQMGALYRMANLAIFDEAATRWAGYDRLSNRVRAVAVKAPSVLRSARAARHARPREVA